MDNNCDNSIKAPKVGHKMGYCTKRFFKKTLFTGNMNKGIHFIIRLNDINKLNLSLLSSN